MKDRAAPLNWIPSPLRRRDGRIIALIAGVLVIVVAVLINQAPRDTLLAGHSARIFGPAPTSPTAREGQSRLWYADARWWAVLYERTSGTYRIAYLDAAERQWVDSGTEVDERDSAGADALWDGTRLHVVSAGEDAGEARHAARALRFSYDQRARRYTLDEGYPVEITPGGVRAMSLARDGTGRIWATYTQNRRVRIVHSEPDSTEWTDPYDLPAEGATGLLSQDQSTIVAFDGEIGVMWSNQTRGVWTYRFARHADGASDQAWRSTIAEQSFKGVDNHMFLLGLSGDRAARVLALVKTSLTRPDDPLYNLLALQPDGTWAKHRVWRAAENVSRARIAVDLERRRIYAYSATPCCSGGEIRIKETDLDRISFPPGRGKPLIVGDGVRANNPTSTRQPITGESGLVVLAADEESSRYLYSTLDEVPESEQDAP